MNSNGEEWIAAVLPVDYCASEAAQRRTPDHNEQNPQADGV
jgi:hypothetical protein